VYRLKSPLRVNFELTEACNNACVHCYNFWRYQETGEKISKDNHSRDYEHFERMLDVIIAQEVRTVTFTGGEPLLRKDVLYPLVAKAKAAKLRVLINTNATLLTPDDVEKLRQLQVDGYLVSLLCADETTHNAMTNANSYTRTMQGIEWLVDSGQPVSVNMVTSRDNLPYVRATAQKISDMGVFQFSATPMLSCYLSAEHEKINLTPDQVKQVMRDLVWAKTNLPMNITVLDTVVYCMFSEEERNEFDSILGERYCCAGISDCALSPDGDLRPCILSTDVGRNILTDGWEQPWEKLSAWKEPSMIPSECLDCSVVGSCGGGCRAAAKARHGSYKDRDPYMTVPIVTQPSSHSQPTSIRKLEDSDVLSASSDLEWRDEPFGAMLFNGDKCVFLKDDPASFLRSLIESGPFSISSVWKEYGVAKGDARNFFQTLVADNYNDSIHWAIPVESDTVDVLAMWAHKDAGQTYVEGLLNALSHYKSLLSKDNGLFIGDMNNNVRWDHKTKKEWQWATYVEELRKLDKHSVWHKTKGEEHGLESVSTLFWYRQPERGYHIDYVFGSELLIEKAKIEIGAHEDWLMHSDHVPLVLDVAN